MWFNWDKDIMAKNKYDFGKTLRKFGIDIAIVFLTGLITVWQGNIAYLALIPFLKAALNWLKHRN